MVRPGHIFPLRSHPGGVLARPGHTEGSITLAKLAGLKPASVICEIMREDGTMADMTDLLVFARQHNLCLVAMRDVVAAVKPPPA